jgi:Dolichyl-phosphate-mannose-protein mannosyltransferase
MYISLNIPHRGILILSLAIPGILAAFTHLWNPTGFPNGPSNDEGIYIRRAMHVLSGQGPQESLLYDHPYFSQLFFASVLSLIGYPNSLNPSVGDVHSIETLYLVPRILMGMLAVADTFLIYKISERRYNRNVAFIASVLFAVMPITTWLIRWILLDAIQLPFLLSSILFAVYYTKDSKINNLSKNKRNLTLILLSGIFLGLAIFTKIPAFTMIPVVGFLIYTKNNNRHVLGLWLVPVILIPLIWPIYSISVSRFNYWLDGILWQIHRASQPLFGSVQTFFNNDPILLIFGISGLIFAAIKKDLLLLLWFIPLLVFLHLIGFVSLYHLIPLLPVFCIAAARFIEGLTRRITNKNAQQIFLQFIIISVIGIFGLSNTIIMLTTNVNSSYFKAAAFIPQYLQNNNYKNTYNNNNKVTIIADAFYLWIPQYIFHLDQDYKNYFDNTPTKAEKILLIVDRGFLNAMSRNDESSKIIEKIYNSQHTSKLLTFHENPNKGDRVSIYLYESNKA